MAIANLDNNFVNFTTQGTTTTGTLMAMGAFNGPINYSLNQQGNSFSLLIKGPVKGFMNNGVITTMNPIPQLTKTIIQQIPLSVSDGLIVNPTIGIFMIAPSGITIYSSINGEPFVQDTTNQQGWNNGFIINFSI